jgi:hypothetical protein
MNEFMKHHKGSVIFTIVTMLLGFGYGLYLFGNIPQALGIVFIMGVLGVLEVSLSIDNAIVNAKVLQGMDEVWRRRFVTWGMLFAVGIMRLVFPILIVSLAGNIGMFEAVQLAISDQAKYSQVLSSAHILIAGFGGAFLLLVALDYFFDVEKDVHWVHFIESKLSKLGARKSTSIVVTIGVLYYFYTILPQTESLSFFMSGILGIVTHEAVKFLGDLMESGEDSSDINLTGVVAKNGLASFLYLEILDSSFSLDGVIGALVISTDIFIIAGGLAIGAMAVRSMTLQLVANGTLNEYKYLEHGAFYAIFTLAVIMFVSTLMHIPEVITGALSVSFIVAAVWHSVIVNKREGESL